MLTYKNNSFSIEKFFEKADSEAATGSHPDIVIETEVEEGAKKKKKKEKVGFRDRKVDNNALLPIVDE